MTLISLGDLLFNAETIAVVKPIDEDQCVIFTTGQSATDSGFLIPLSKEEVEEELSKVDRNVLLDLAERLQAEIEGEGEEEEEDGKSHAMDRRNGRKRSG